MRPRSAPPGLLQPSAPSPRAFFRGKKRAEKIFPARARPAGGRRAVFSLRPPGDRSIPARALPYPHAPARQPCRLLSFPGDFPEKKTAPEAVPAPCAPAFSSHASRRHEERRDASGGQQKTRSPKKALLTRQDPAGRRKKFPSLLLAFLSQRV